jgi:hypothetical protein
VFTFNKYSLFLSSLVICINETVGLWRMDFERSLWWSVEQCVFNVILLVHYRCQFVVSLVWDMLNTDRIWEGPWSWKKEQNRFRKYLLPSSSECCTYSSIKLKLFLSYCVGVKFGVLRQEKHTDWWFLRAGCEENVWCESELGVEGSRRICSELHVC